MNYFAAILGLHNAKGIRRTRWLQPAWLTIDNETLVVCYPPNGKHRIPWRASMEDVHAKDWVLVTE